MFRTLTTVVFATLILGALPATPAWAQESTYHAAPHVDLDATLGSAPVPATSDTVPKTGAELFNDPPAPDGGWKALADILETLSPKVDTSIPLTPSDITDRITTMINQGRYDEALHIIEQRKIQRQQQNLMGADVQLLFLEGRALSESGQSDKAIAAYRDMTVNYPELPEPWNNLSAEYVRQNNLDMAEQALQTALTINPDYATARLNLGIVQLMKARASFGYAARLGISEARKLEAGTTQLLQP